MAHGIGALIGLILALTLVSIQVHSEDRAIQKEILRLQYTEFCSTVTKPPQVIADALNNAMAQDPKTWLPAVLWWNRIAEQYEKAKCGDA